MLGPSGPSGPAQTLTVELAGYMHGLLSWSLSNGNAGPIFRYKAARSFTLPYNFVGSQGGCEIPPTTANTMFIYKDLVKIGTVTFNTNGTVSFSSDNPTAVTFNAGDTLLVQPQVTDATLGWISLTFLGTR